MLEVKISLEFNEYLSLLAYVEDVLKPRVQILQNVAQDRLKRRMLRKYEYRQINL